MDKVSINRSGLSIFKRAEEVKNQSNTHHNPFGISFKGSVLHADVFENTMKPAVDSVSKVGMTDKGKLFASAIVGNLTNFQNGIKQRWNSVVSFGKQAKEQVVEMWKKANQIDVSLPNIVTSFKNQKAEKNIATEVRELMAKPVSELSDMFKSSIAAKA